MCIPPLYNVHVLCTTMLHELRSCILRTSSFSCEFWNKVSNNAYMHIIDLLYCKMCYFHIYRRLAPGQLKAKEMEK